MADADGPDLLRRADARAAIVESAPAHLEPLIARFAAEDQFSDAAVDALGRIGNRSSRMSLRTLFEHSDQAPRRAAVVLALARVGHADDADFLAGVLLDRETDEETKHYAALGLGHIGGDRAVKYLERALEDASPDTRRYIARALGNTRSRMAVPVLIEMFVDSPARNEVCNALVTLTRRTWCDGTGDDRALQTVWRRWWAQTKSRVEIYGPDNCADVREPLTSVR